MSTRSVANAAGVNISLIAYYFGGKEGLYRAIIEEHVAGVFAQFPSDATAADFSGLDRATLRQVLESIITLNVTGLNADPDIALIAQRELLDGAPRAQSLIDGLLEVMLHQLEALVDTGKQKGFIRSSIATTTFLMLLSRAIDSYFSMFLMIRGRVRVAGRMLDPTVDPAAFAAQVVTVFLDGALENEA